MPLPVPLPVIAAATIEDGGRVYAADADAVRVAERHADGSVQLVSTIGFSWNVDVAVADGRSLLVLGEAEGRARVALVDVGDRARPLVRREAMISGARWVGGWAGGEDAWLHLRAGHDAAVWAEEAGTRPLGDAGADLLVHVELRGDELPTATPLGSRPDAIYAGEGAAWARAGRQLTRIILPERGPATPVASGMASPPRPGAELLDAVALGDDLLVAWQDGGRVELSRVGADGTGGLRTREYVPGGVGRFVSLHRDGDGVVLATSEGNPTGLRLGTDGKLERKARAELTATSMRVPAHAALIPDLPDLSCTPTPNPPPSSAPKLGQRVVVHAGHTWAIRPDTQELWRVDEDQARPLGLVADGLWLGGGRVLALVDGGRRLALLDEAGEHVERSVPLAGNVYAMVTTPTAAWVELDTGDSRCGTALVRVPYDASPSNTAGLAAAPGPLTVRGEAALAAVQEPGTERSVVVALGISGSVRTVAHVDGLIGGMGATEEGVRVAWQRSGIGVGLSELVVSAEGWREETTKLVDARAELREAWVADDLAVLRLGGVVADRICRVDEGVLGACVDAAPGQEAWTARLGDALLVGVGEAGMVSLGGEDGLAVARTEHAAFTLAECREGATRKACRKALEATEGERILAVGQDGDLVATVSTAGVVVRDAKTGRVRARGSFGG